MIRLLLPLILLVHTTLHAQESIPEHLCSEREQQWAAFLPMLEEMLMAGTEDYDSIQMILEGCLYETPEDYRNEFSWKGKRYIKFWDSDEYHNCQRLYDPGVILLYNAYPKACYLLSIIHLERGMFEEAFDVLMFGFELEPYQPNLINQMGNLLSRWATTKGDTSLLHLSNRYFQAAFVSRDHNTNAQKARSLRGLGFNHVESGDLELAREYFLHSLNYAEHKYARNELKTIEWLLENPDKGFSSPKSNVDKDNLTGSYEHYKELENRLPRAIRENVPSGYIYIWTKACNYLLSDAAYYRENDYFHFPLVEWDIPQIDLGVNQIVGYLKGVSPDLPLEMNSLRSSEELLHTFHFVKKEESVISRSEKQTLIEVRFQHRMEGWDMVLYFLLPNEV